MKQFFLKFFTWWSGQTFGTQLWTKRYGELVGQDEQGNRYYRTRGGAIDTPLGVANGRTNATAAAALKILRLFMFKLLIP